MKHSSFQYDVLRYMTDHICLKRINTNFQKKKASGFWKEMKVSAWGREGATGWHGRRPRSAYHGPLSWSTGEMRVYGA